MKSRYTLLALTLALAAALPGAAEAQLFGGRFLPAGLGFGMGLLPGLGSGMGFGAGMAGSPAFGRGFGAGTGSGTAWGGGHPSGNGFLQRRAAVEQRMRHLRKVPPGSLFGTPSPQPKVFSSPIQPMSSIPMGISKSGLMGNTVPQVIGPSHSMSGVGAISGGLGAPQGISPLDSVR
jgi:hypothetical protein